MTANVTVRSIDSFTQSESVEELTLPAFTAEALVAEFNRMSANDDRLVWTLMRSVYQREGNVCAFVMGADNEPHGQTLVSGLMRLQR